MAIYPSSGLLDTFQRANQNPIANIAPDLWRISTYWGDPLKIISNRAANSLSGASGFGGMWWSVSQAGDIETYVTTITMPGTDGNGVTLDIFSADSGTPDGYEAAWGKTASGIDMFLYRIDAGAYTQLGSTTAVAGFTDGDAHMLRRTSTGVQVWVRLANVWSQILSIADTTYAGTMVFELGMDESNGTPGTIRVDFFGGGIVDSMPNLQAETATVIPSFPSDATQTIQEGYVPNRVWDTFTAPQSGVINIFPFGDLTNYDVELTVRVNNAVDLYRGLQNRRQVPTYFQVTAGVQYWLDFPAPTTNYLSASPLRVQASFFAPTAIPSGAIFINDESTADSPASYMDPVTGEVVSFLLDFPGGEQMVQLTDGTLFLEDIDTTSFAVYSADKVFVATAAGIYNNIHISSNRTTRFYSGNSSTFQVQAWSPLAVSLQSWTVASAPVSLAPSRDDEVLYYAAGTTGAAVRRWDLGADAGMADLAVGVSGYVIKEIFVLQDESILVIYRRTSPYDVYIVRYDVDGTTLNTYATQLDDSVGADTHLAFTNEDPTTFAVWIKIAGGYSRFMVLQTSDGTILSSFDRVHFSSGSSDADPAADPPAFYGPSESCTFLITTTSSSGCPGRRSGQQIGA